MDKLFQTADYEWSVRKRFSSGLWGVVVLEWLEEYTMENGAWGRFNVAMQVSEDPDIIELDEVTLTGGRDGFEGVGWLLEWGVAAANLQANIPDHIKQARVEITAGEMRRWNLYKRVMVPRGFRVVEELDLTEPAPMGIMVKKYKRLENGVYF